MLSFSHPNRFWMGLTKKVQPYWKLATATMLRTPAASWTQRTKGGAGLPDGVSWSWGKGGFSFPQGNPSGASSGDDAGPEIRLHHHQQSHQSGQDDAVPEDVSHDRPFLTRLIGRRIRADDP